MSVGKGVKLTTKRIVWGTVTDIDYPVVVDAKILSSLIICGEAIFRKPEEKRLKTWHKLKKILHKQQEESYAKRQRR